MESSTYPNPKVVQASRYFVNVVAHREAGHGSRTVGPDKVKMCKLYPTISCEDHQKVEQKALSNYVKGSFFVPLTIFTDSEGKELSREQGPLDPTEIVKQMNDILGRTPGEKISGDLWAGAHKVVADGKELIAKDQYAKAITEFKKLSGQRQKAIKEMGDEALNYAAEQGIELLKKAQGLLAEGKEAEAKKILTMLAKECSGFSCGKEAARILKDLKK